jgi:hypothetical protein
MIMKCGFHFVYSFCCKESSPPVLTSSVLGLRGAKVTPVGLHVKCLLLCLDLHHTEIRPLI